MIYITVSKIKSTGLRRLALVLSYPFIVIAQTFLCIWTMLQGWFFNVFAGLFGVVAGVIVPIYDFIINMINTQAGLGRSAAEQWKKQ